MTQVADRVRHILDALPEGVLLVAAAKTRSPEEVREACEAGLRAVGHNYIQEGQAMREALDDLDIRWHFIGPLQRNKARHAVRSFDVVETVDSLRLARALDKRCRIEGRTLPVLLEVNSGREASKHGVLPGDVAELARQVSQLEHLRVHGLMTMGPFTGDPEASRPYFVITRRLFDELGAMDLPGVEMAWLSMGMSNSWQVAVQEGANIVRIGTAIFGPRA